VGGAFLLLQVGVLAMYMFVCVCIYPNKIWWRMANTIFKAGGYALNVFLC